MILSRKMLAAVVACATLCACNQMVPHDEVGYLDDAKLITWEDVKTLTPAEKAASEALLHGRPEAKQRLLDLKRNGHDSVLVRKGLVDLMPDTKTLLERVSQLSKAAKARHADTLELGYIEARLTNLHHKGLIDAPDLPIGLTVRRLKAMLKDLPSFGERVAAGVILSEIGELGETREIFASAAKDAPQKSGIQLLYAWSLVNIGSDRHPAEPKVALPHALAAIRLEPKNATAYGLAATCYTLLGDTLRANEYYAQFVKWSDPTTASAKAVRSHLEKQRIAIPK